MHGIINAELKKYVETKLGKEAWRALKKQAGLEQKGFLMTGTYPDEDTIALVTAAANITKKPAAEILEDFGRFIVPDLLKVYGSWVSADWKTLDLLEHTETDIHRAVRMRDKGAAPPALVATRPSPKEVVVEYSSGRKLCAVAVGIAKGVADHYREKVSVQQTTCMTRGDPRCLISVKLV